MLCNLKMGKGSLWMLPAGFNRSTESQNIHTLHLITSNAEIHILGTALICLKGVDEHRWKILLFKNKTKTGNGDIDQVSK